MADVRHAAARGFCLDGFARRALGADEQHLAAIGDNLTNERRRLVVHRQRLFEVDDVNPVTFPENVLSHFGVPEAGLMSEMNTRFQHLSHGHAGHEQTPVGVEPPLVPYDDLRSFRYRDRIPDLRVSQAPRRT